jgi:diacylglycerol O-acyltransferase / wax synthase
MVSNFPIGPIMDGGGLNMTVMSYLDQLDFGLQACPDVLPDVWSLAEGLQESLDELVTATGVEPAEVEKLTRSA